MKGRSYGTYGKEKRKKKMEGNNEKGEKVLGWNNRTK
jgi:hypothetical protein